MLIENFKTLEGWTIGVDRSSLTLWVSDQDLSSICGGKALDYSGSGSVNFKVRDALLDAGISRMPTPMRVHNKEGLIYHYNEDQFFAILEELKPIGYNPLDRFGFKLKLLRAAGLRLSPMVKAGDNLTPVFIGTYPGIKQLVVAAKQEQLLTSNGFTIRQWLDAHQPGDTNNKTLSPILGRELAAAYRTLRLRKPQESHGVNVYDPVDQALILIILKRILS